MNAKLIGAVVVCCWCVLSACATEMRTWAGTVTNTTHDVAAPMQMELVVDGDSIAGWLVTEAPLQPGRWALKGVRKGAWCEVTCQQSPETTTVFRGVLGADVFRGTYVVGGGGVLSQYGRFHLKLAAK